MPLSLRAVYFCLLVVLGFGPVQHSQAQSLAPAWESAITLGQRDISANTIATSSRAIIATVPDGQGNLYVAGYFVGTVAFGATTLVSTLYTGYTDTYSSDIFVAKWSLSGQRYLWATSASGPGSEGVSRLVVSGFNVYIAGTSLSRLSKAGSLSFGATTLTTGTGYSIFVAKLTDTGTSGSWKWGKTGNCEYLTSLIGLAVNGTAVYLAGDLSGTIKFDSKSVKSNQTLAYNVGDLLLVKFTDAGSTATLNWVQLTGSATYEEADAFAISGTSLYVAAHYFNTSTIGSTTMPNTGTSTDALITKFTDTGTAVTPIWTQHMGGTGSDGISSLVASGSSVYVAGDFTSPSLGLGIPATTTLINQDAAAATSDLFLAKLVDAGSSGSFAWARQVGGAGSEQASQLLHASNALYLAGTFQGPTATFGRTVLTNVSTTDGLQDVYVARFDEIPTGASLSWAQRAGSTSYDYPYSLNLLGNRLYVQGYANEAATFGTFTLPKASSYLATLAADAPLATTAATALASLAVYPNPAHGRTSVQLPAAVSGAGPVTLTLRDALGRVTATHTVAGPATGLAQELDLGGLPSGVYLLQVQAAAISASCRLVVN